MWSTGGFSSKGKRDFSSPDFFSQLQRTHASFQSIRVDDMFTWYPPPMEFLNSESKETDGMHIPIGEDYCKGTFNLNVAGNLLKIPSKRWCQ